MYGTESVWNGSTRGQQSGERGGSVPLVVTQWNDLHPYHPHLMEQGENSALPAAVTSMWHMPGGVKRCSRRLHPQPCASALAMQGKSLEQVYISHFCTGEVLCLPIGESFALSYMDRSCLSCRQGSSLGLLFPLCVFLG